MPSPSFASAFMELMRSTSAPGKAFSMPNRIRFSRGGAAEDVCGLRVTWMEHKLNHLDPEAYRRTVLGSIADHPVRRIQELLP